jgi:hypothetical protein
MVAIRRLLRCGTWAGPVFSATFLAEGAVREDYRPLRHPVSSLALGPRGWVQTANFALTGALCLAGAAGLRLAGDRMAGSRPGSALVAAAGVGLIGSAAFPTDPIGGYPPGTPDVPAGPAPKSLRGKTGRKPVGRKASRGRRCGSAIVRTRRCGTGRPAGVPFRGKRT